MIDFWFRFFKRVFLPFCCSALFFYGSVSGLINEPLNALSSGLTSQVWASEFTAIQKNNEGVEFLKEELPTAAYEKFLEGLAEAPFSPALRLNLGLTFEQNKEFQKAFAEYLAAYKNTDRPEFRYFALFNAGSVLGQQKKIPEAISYYQSALEIKPDSKEAKTNIELLIQEQQGGGGGQSDENKKDQKQNQGDDKNDKENEQPNENSKVVNRREQKPQEFKGKELTKKDVEKILEELKNQEQQVRAKQNKKAAKETPRDKDW